LIDDMTTGTDRYCFPETAAATSDLAAYVAGGSPFQTRAAATGNSRTRSPTVERQLIIVIFLIISRTLSVV